ncbi:glyoxalase [Bacillus sp. AFS001701]|nr:glyoxalase [Bacillus sp. AFS001701]
MFFTYKLDEMYSDLMNKNVTVGEIVEMPNGRVFNFADDEQNYFAVMEKNKRLIKHWVKFYLVFFYKF